MFEFQYKTVDSAEPSIKLHYLIFFQTPDYQAKRKQCKELRRKLFHIKRLVKIYDQGLCL